MKVTAHAKKMARRFLSKQKWNLARDRMEGLKMTPLQKYAERCKRILSAKETI